MSYQMLYKAICEVCRFYGVCFIACRPGCELLRQRELREAALQEMVLVIELVICRLVLQRVFSPLCCDAQKENRSLLYWRHKHSP